MEFISKMLFWVANSLLIPDVILLLFLFVRALILIGGTYNMYITKRKNDKAFDHLIKEGRTDELRQALPDKDNSLYISYLRDMLSRPVNEDYADFTLSKFEVEAEKDVALSGTRTDWYADCDEPCIGRAFHRRHRRNGIQHASSVRHHRRRLGSQCRRISIDAVQATLVRQMREQPRLRVARLN